MSGLKVRGQGYRPERCRHRSEFHGSGLNTMVVLAILNTREHWPEVWSCKSEVALKKYPPARTLP